MEGYLRSDEEGTEIDGPGCNGGHWRALLGVAGVVGFGEREREANCGEVACQGVAGPSDRSRCGFHWHSRRQSSRKYNSLDLTKTRLFCSSRI